MCSILGDCAPKQEIFDLRRKSLDDMNNKLTYKCIDRVLCTYEAEYNERVFILQRTYVDTVSIWLDGEKIGTGQNLNDALKIIFKLNLDK